MSPANYLDGNSNYIGREEHLDKDNDEKLVECFDKVMERRTEPSTLTDIAGFHPGSIWDIFILITF